MRAKGLIVLVVAMLLLGGCAPHVNRIAGDSGAGFWMGIWHGLIAPFTLIGSIFTDVGVYEIVNMGFWYNTGFLTGLALVFGIIGFTEGGAALVVFVAVAVTILRGVVDLAVIVWALLK